MRRVRCHECGKRYNFDVDDFCPQCGAFTQPQRTTRIGSDGNVIRVDGINEENHKNSFVHAELHEENRERRRTPLERDVRHTADRQRSVMQIPSEKSREHGKQSPTAIIKWIVLAIVGLNLLTGLIPLLLF